MAMLIHLLGLLTGFIGPLILWLVKKDESRFIDHHGKEAINFMITNFIISLVLIVITVITFGIGVLLYPLVIIAIYVFEIIACVEAYRGVWHRIPWNIRFIQ